MLEVIDLEKIAINNPHLDIAKIKESCNLRKSRIMAGKEYDLALPSERRRAVAGRPAGPDPRTVRLRSSLTPTTQLIPPIPKRDPSSRLPSPG